MRLGLVDKRMKKHFTNYRNEEKIIGILDKMKQSSVRWVFPLQIAPPKSVLCKQF